ncbi:MAG: glycosyl hydrolase family 79 C-terminal domain-containing protein, partial [Mucilaginibacter sp.]
TIQLGRTIPNASVIRLTAPTVLSKDNISLAGRAVGADGTFTPMQPEVYNVNKSSFIVKVPAGSAAIVTLY